MEQRIVPDTLVSVVVITYNSGKYVLETLESIKTQLYSAIELIISDDGSKDNTVSLCRSWLAENENRFIRTCLIASEHNTGTTRNCNRGIKAARGEWIKIIAGDDVLVPHLISTYISVATSRPNVAALFSEIQPYYNSFCPEHITSIESNKSERFNHLLCPPEVQFEILLRINCVNAPTVMLQTAVLRKLSGFDESFYLMEDWPMWLALTKAGYKMHYVDMIGVKYRLHQHSVQGKGVPGIYKSRVESEVDRMYLEMYARYMPFPERQARLLIIYRDKLLIRLFQNRNNRFIKLVARLLGFVPFQILKHYREKVLYAQPV